MKILLTGAKGFIGTFFAKASKENLILAEHSTRYKTKNNTVEFDLTNLQHCRSLIKDVEEVDIIVHLAAQTPFRKTSKKISFSNEMKMTRNITSIANSLKVKKFIFVSGWVVYSCKDTAPISEKSLTDPSSDYGKSKLWVEEYLKKNLTDTRLVVLRASSIYGPGQISTGLIPNLVKSSIEKGGMTISDPKIKRDYMYIGDFVKVIGNVINSEIPDREVINIGSGKSYAVIDVAKMIAKIIREQTSKSVELSIIRGKGLPAFVDNRLDISRARHYKVINFKKTDLEAGLCKYILWVLKEKF